MSEFKCVMEVNSTSCDIKDKAYSYDGFKYNIKNYDRSMMSDDSTNLLAYKSVIYDETGTLLSVAPPKSISWQYFSDHYECDANIEISETIEGTMINVFYNGEKWVLSTRGAIGGKYFYFRNQYYVDANSSNRQVSFNDMFMEAIQSDENEEFNDNVMIQNLDKAYGYSFVMRHPDNHIVIPVKFPDVYLVGVHQVNNEADNKKSFTLIDRNVYENFDCFKNGVVHFPKVYETKESYTENLDTYVGLQEPYTNVGIMFVNKQSGVRCSVKTQSYSKLKELRGNNPNLQYQYLSLRRAEKVDEFLNYFPQYKKLFFKFYKQYKDFVFNVHRSYIARYITKKEKVISNKYMPHIFRIHQEMFVPFMLNGEKTTIKLDNVYKYFSDRSVTEMLYALNYDVREMKNKQHDEKTL